MFEMSGHTLQMIVLPFVWNASFANNYLIMHTAGNLIPLIKGGVIWKNFKKDTCRVLKKGGDLIKRGVPSFCCCNICNMTKKAQW